MTTQIKLAKLAILLILTAAIITACGENLEENLPSNLVTLSILTPSVYTPLIRAVESDMQEYFAETGIDFYIEITDYNLLDGMELMQQNATLQTMLMAGDGYDIVFLNWLPPNIRSFADNGFLLNVYDLIDQDPNLTRDDFFTSVLSALEYRGGLYNFPLTFGFDFIGINANLPDSVLNDFSEKSQLSMLEIMQILAALQAEYPEIYANFPYNSNFSLLYFPTSMLSRIVHDFFDFDNAESHFDSAKFVDFITVMQGTIPIHAENFNPANIIANFTMINEMTQMAEQNIFLHTPRIGRNFSPLIPLFGTVDNQFFRFLPIADTHGNLLLDTTPTISDTWADVIFPAVGDGVVAWGFTQRLLHRMLLVAPNDFSLNFGTGLGTAELAIPILRSELEPHFNRVMNHFSHFEGRFSFTPLNGIQPGINDTAEIAAASAAALARLTELANSPVSVIDANAAALFEDDLIDSFMLGSISAETLAQEFQNRASLWLMGG